MDEEWKGGEALDALLREALLAANDPERLGIPPEEALEGTLEFSPEFEEKMARVLADPAGYERRARSPRPVWRQFLRAAACAALVLALGFGGAMLTPGGRAAVTSFFSRNFEDHTEFGFVDPAAGTQAPEPEAGAYVPSYVPEGYECREWDWDDGFGTARAWYEGAYDLYYIDYMCFPLAHAPTISVDNEHSEEKQIEINGVPAKLLEGNVPFTYDLEEADGSTRAVEYYTSFLVWTDEEAGYGFFLMGTCPAGDLVDMAESLEWQAS